MYLLYGIAGLAGTSILLLIYTVLRSLFNTRLKIVNRIQSIEETSKKRVEDDPYSLPFKERIVLPFFKSVERSVIKWTPQSLKQKEQLLLKQAGYPRNLTLQEWMAARMIIWFALGLIFTSIGISAGSFLSILLISSIGWILGYIAPVFYLKKKKDDRKNEIERGLPYVLDILTVSVDAGLGFDAALVKVVEKTHGTLTNEFNKTLQEIKMGKTRRDALKDLGERTGADDLIQFVGSIIQAEQLGVSLGNVLRVQSEDMRQKKKQRAEEKAMKAPIKILFPLVLFIFPAVFIIILGPAIINMMGTLF